MEQISFRQTPLLEAGTDITIPTSAGIINVGQKNLMRIAPLRYSDLGEAKRVIATVVLEYYFDGRYTVDGLLAHYEKSGYLADFARLEEEYGGNAGLLLGAFEGETVVGTGGVRRIDAESGELVRLWLLRDFRGRGIGRQMVGCLLDFAHRVGMKRLRLDTSFRCKEAVALFRRVGFCEIPRYKESIGDCFMELDLIKKPNWVAGGN